MKGEYFIVIILNVIILLLIRPLVLWYFKIPQILKALNIEEKKEIKRKVRANVHPEARPWEPGVERTDDEESGDSTGKL